MQAVSADPKAPEPAQGSFGISQGLRRSQQNNGVVEKFAQKMAADIIQSFVSQMEMVWPEVNVGVSKFNENPEMLADVLASAVIEVALREVCRGQNVEEFQSSRSARGKTDQYESKGNFLNVDTEMDPGKESQTYRGTNPCHPPLSQSGLPIVGSLDYPDAPPTTPLLPELERSRQSFARKLKGGLAKVFLPSTPPPTPKDKDSDSPISDLQVDLMEHLMHSLPTDDLAMDDYEEGAKMEAFAKALSCDIINCALRAKIRADDSDINLLASQLAENIIISCLDEARV